MPVKGPKKHSPPPERIITPLSPFVIELKESFFRMHESAWGPIFFGRNKSGRFDDPLGKYGVLYAGATYFGAFSETVGQEIAPAELAENVLDQVVSITDLQLTTSHLCVLRPKRAIRLVDLTGPFLRHFGADARLIVGDDYDLSQKFSRAIYGHPDRVDGIRYRARSDPEQVSFAIFKRDPAVIEVERKLGSLLEPRNSEILARILTHYKIALVRVRSPGRNS